MKRRAFLAAGAALVGLPNAARATGGLDVAGPAVPHEMRVLLASGTFDAPRPIDAWHFAWRERTYRGFAATPMMPDGRPALINIVPLDAYIAGVLGKEISASWAPGAQQAQAIVARTYALGRLHPNKPYDVVAGEADQAYDGIAGESVEGRAAVDATAGIVVTYENAAAHVAYSSCCGGQTADAGDVWDTPFPYLRAIVDPNCAGSPGYTWEVDVPADSLATAFGSPLAAIGELRSIELSAPSPTDRPRDIRFVGDASSLDVKPARFRASLGTSVVRSTFVRSIALAPGGASVTVAGTGHGHGVGMCQWGARELGDRGASARDIIAFYFPGTDLGRA